MADDFAQLVKQQTDIVRLVGEYVKLRKTGAQNYTGLCPFHKEKTGSFSVNATHGYFYCFGCHEKGDVFTFVMKLESLSFPEAVRTVATKMGIALPKREWNSPEEAREAGLRRQLLDIHEAATQYFEQALKTAEGARAREYLTGRGVSAETIKTFRIGYARRLQPHARCPEGTLQRRGDAREWAVQLEGAGGRFARANVRAISQAGDLSHRE
jgi:DNA primase